MRINLVNIILGNRGTGKTFYIKQLLEAYKKAHPDKKILIVDTLDHPSYALIAPIELKDLKAWRKPSVYRIFGSNTNEIIEEIENNVSNALIIFEDASKYVGKLMESHVRKMIFDSKQKNNDLIFLFHGFMATPPELFRICDTITLFKTGDHPKCRKNNMVNYNEIEVIYNEILKSKNKYENKTIQIY
jgi:Cdc6-like AAA superfamily ATPase